MTRTEILIRYRRLRQISKEHHLGVLDIIAPEIWLVDETMEKTARPGLEIAARVLKPAGFSMTARIVVPVVPNPMEEAFTRAPALRHARGDDLAGDPRFAIAIYRAAVAIGIMDAVRLKK